MAKSKTKRGSLTAAEKLKIQEMHSNGMEIKDIAESLNRGNVIVKNYVNDFMQLVSQEKKVVKDSKEEERKKALNKAIQEAKTKLVEKEKQVTEKQFQERLAYIMSRKKHPKTAKDICEAILIYKPVIENMRGEGYDRSIIVNSEAASSVSDHHKKKHKGFSRTTRGAVFSTKHEDE